MKSRGILSAATAVLLLILSPPAHAQDYLFSVPELRMQVTVNADASVGIGFRYNLGFAPIRADLAFPLTNPNNKGINEQPFQVYISIGQSF